MSKYEQYLVLYRCIRRQELGVWASCPQEISELGLCDVWGKAYRSYLDSFVIDPLTLSLKDRLYRRKYSLAYAA